MRAFLLVAVVIGLIVAFTWRGGGSSSVEWDGDTYARVLYLTVLGSAIGFGFFAGGWRNIRRDFKDLAFWGVALLILVGVYTFKDDFKSFSSRIVGGLVPGTAVEQAPGEYVITRSANGMFVVDGEANGKSIRFLFDTGASGVSLTAQDARAVGIEPLETDYSIEVRTANGIARVAPAMLQTLTVGGITLTSVRVTVSKDGALSRSLLGHGFLNRLRSYEVRGDRLILKG